LPAAEGWSAVANHLTDGQGLPRRHHAGVGLALSAALLGGNRLLAFHQLKPHGLNQVLNRATARGHKVPLPVADLKELVGLNPGLAFRRAGLFVSAAHHLGNVALRWS